MGTSIAQFIRSANVIHSNAYFSVEIVTLGAPNLALCTLTLVC